MHMKTTVTKIVQKEFDRSKLFVELEKMLEYKHPFTLASDKKDVTHFRLEYVTTEVEDATQLEIN